MNAMDQDGSALGQLVYRFQQLRQIMTEDTASCATGQSSTRPF